MYKAQEPVPIVAEFANVVAFRFQVEFGGNIGWLYDWPMEKKKSKNVCERTYLINFEFVERREKRRQSQTNW